MKRLASVFIGCQLAAALKKLEQSGGPITVGVILSAPIREYLHLFERLARRLDIDIRVHHVARGSRRLPAAPGYESSVLEPEVRGNPMSFLAVRSWKIFGIIGRTDCDVWLIGGWNRFCYWQAVLACWLFRKRYVIRGTSHLRKPTSWWVSVVKFLVLRPFLARASGVLAVGKLNAELYRHYCPGVPAFAVPQFFDETRLAVPTRAVEESRLDTRRRFGFSADDFVILFVGRLAREKSIEDLIAAVANLSRKTEGVRLLVVGQGTLLAQLAASVRHHQIAAVFAGHVPRADLPAIFRCADTLVLPSESEPWGFVVAEAMSLGIPPVVSDRVGCAPELIVQHRTGIVFRHGDVEGLTGALRWLEEDRQRRAAVGADARLRIFGPKSMDHTVDMFVSAMTAVARGPVRNRYRRLRWFLARWRRWSMVSHGERLLLIRATANLGLTCLKLKLFPFRDHFTENRGGNQVVDAAQIETARKIGWAVRTMSRYTPWESKCLVQSLAARDMLMAEGISSSILIGVDKVSRGQLEAHAWLECGPLIVTGEEEHSRFRRMTVL